MINFNKLAINTDLFNPLWNKILNWGTNFLPKLFGAIVIFVIGWWLAGVLVKLILNVLEKGKAEETARSFLNSFILSILRIVVIITAVAQLGVNVTSIVAALGVAAVTVGLALKDSMSNIASGILIIINKPFRVGDYLQFENLEGTVYKIEIMNTYLKTFDNKEVIIPNSRLTANNIINYTARAERRLDLHFLIRYNDDISIFKKLLNEIIIQENRILKDPKPFVGVDELNDDGVRMIVKVWCKLDDYWDVNYAMQEKVIIALEANGFTRPYRQITINQTNQPK
ncbi:MAG: mechanosensitive ion channel [Bacillota bacterium]|nr:mechanosensitive ion channel [Bacillota bacterium]